MCGRSWPKGALAFFTAFLVDRGSRAESRKAEDYGKFDRLPNPAKNASAASGFTWPIPARKAVSGDPRTNFRPD